MDANTFPTVMWTPTSFSFFYEFMSWTPVKLFRTTIALTLTL